MKKYIGIFSYENEFGSVGDFKLTKKSTALHNDIVDIVINDKEIYVIEIVKRKHRFIPGVVLFNGPIMKVVNKNVIMKKFIPDNRNLPTFLIRTRKKTQQKNEYCLAEFVEWNDPENYPISVYNSKIGDIGVLKDEHLYMLHCNDVKWKKHKKYKIDDLIDLTPDRIVIDDVPIVSIDPEGCIDIDDALHFKQYKDYFEIGIHIADVSSFIEVGSELDKLVAQRCESLYLYDKQINMFPDEIVSCMSLKKNRLSRAFSIIIKYDLKGDMSDIKFFKSLVKVTHNLSYDKAKHIINYCNDKEKLTSSLISLYNFGKSLYTDNFYDIHKMVEVYMILANKQVAYAINKKKIYDIVCRTHNGFKGKIIEDIYKPNILNIINNIKSEAAQYKLKSETDNSRHDGLNVELYTHFTSPIRRYIDIIIHRMLYNTMYKKVCPGYLQYQVNIINRQHKNISKASRQSKQLYLIHNYETFASKGYIVSIREDHVLVYVKEIDMIIKCQLYSDKIKHLLYVTYDDKSVTIDRRGYLFSLKLGIKVHVNIIICPKATKFKDKIFGEIIKPNVSELLEKIMLGKAI